MKPLLTLRRISARKLAPSDDQSSRPLCWLQSFHVLDVNVPNFTIESLVEANECSSLIDAQEVQRARRRTKWIECSVPVSALDDSLLLLEENEEDNALLHASVISVTTKLHIIIRDLPESQLEGEDDPPVWGNCWKDEDTGDLCAQAYCHPGELDELWAAPMGSVSLRVRLLVDLYENEVDAALNEPWASNNYLLSSNARCYLESIRATKKNHSEADNVTELVEANTPDLVERDTNAALKMTNPTPQTSANELTMIRHRLSAIVALLTFIGGIVLFG